MAYRLVVCGGLAAGPMVIGAEPAAAEVSGDCTATIAGHDVGLLSSSEPSDAIAVDYDDTIAVQASTAGPVGEYRIELEAFGVRWTVADGSSDTSAWSRDANVSTYAEKVKSGGLLKVIGTGGGCTGAALLSIDYKGTTPLATPLGLAGATLTGVGVASVVGTGMRAARGRVAA